MNRLRSFFSERNYLEVETPAMARTPIPERYIELFRTDLIRPDYARSTPTTEEYFLLPSPEYYLKRLLSDGVGNLFEICKAYRNVESTGPLHNPEFTMLEWYTVNATADDSLSIMVDLLTALEIDAPPLVIPVDDAFLLWAKIDLSACDDRDALASAARGAGIDPGTASWEDLFQRLFLSLVEPEIPTDRPVFLTDYPAMIPTLAKVRPDGRRAERWELYLGGIETANCYTEETDPGAIARFIASEAAAKARSAAVPHPSPERYLSAERPLPPCSGAALGVDRLVMYCTGTPSIKEVLSFTGEE